METVEVKKLFRNTVSIRDYLVKDCISKGVPLKIIFRGQYMILTPVDLRVKRFQLTNKSFKSKFDKWRYRLFDYHWSPDN